MTSKIERIINSRIENGEVEYFVVLSDEEHTVGWVNQNDLKNCDGHIHEYTKTRDLIQKLNEESCTASANSMSQNHKLFGFKRREKDKRIKPVRVENVIQLNGILICEMQWQKGKHLYTDLVSYWELFYQRNPHFLIAWHERQLMGQWKEFTFDADSGF